MKNLIKLAITLSLSAIILTALLYRNELSHIDLSQITWANVAPWMIGIGIGGVVFFGILLIYFFMTVNDMKRLDRIGNRIAFTAGCFAVLYVVGFGYYAIYPTF
ncbi:MAG: hypothetical protein WCO58_02360 [bacterium]